MNKWDDLGVPLFLETPMLYPYCGLEGGNLQEESTRKEAQQLAPEKIARDPKLPTIMAFRCYG